MIHYVFALALLSPSLKNYKIDTLNFWHIYYNKEKIKEFNEASKENVIQLVLGSVKKEDSLSIKYFSNTRCANCSFTLRIPTDEGISFFEVSRYTKSISLSLETIKALLMRNKMHPMTISLAESKGSMPDRYFSLFTIKIE